MRTGKRIRTLGFDHARYGCDPITPDQLRAIIYMLMAYETVTEDFENLHAAYLIGFQEWLGQTVDSGFPSEN